MPFDPDTEIQYRKGGKIMKKKTKKFYGGGITEGENANIDSDTRERALAAVKARMEAADAAPPAKKEAAPRPGRPIRRRSVGSFAGEGDTNSVATRDAPRDVGMLEALKTRVRAAAAPKEPKYTAVYKKGGGVEAKGKTKGKTVKMAKGGTARGYGVSKVTNKTKYV
jgi:hypothetical protein